MYRQSLYSLHPQAAANQKANLKALGKKVLLMEDLFRQFQTWLDSCKNSLDELSPAATDQTEREEQRKKAKV